MITIDEYLERKTIMKTLLLPDWLDKKMRKRTKECQINFSAYVRRLIIEDIQESESEKEKE